MIYLNEPYVLVQWDDDVKCVHIEWKAFADGTEYRQAHETLLRALIENGGKKMLGDTRAMKAVAPEDQAWLTKDFLPRAAAKGLVYSAIVLPKSAVAQLSLQRIIVNSSPPPNAPKDHAAYFDNVEAAKSWLRGIR